MTRSPFENHGDDERRITDLDASNRLARANVAELEAEVERAERLYMDCQTEVERLLGEGHDALKVIVNLQAEVERLREQLRQQLNEYSNVVAEVERLRGLNEQNHNLYLDARARLRRIEEAARAYVEETGAAGQGMLLVELRAALEGK